MASGGRGEGRGGGGGGLSLFQGEQQVISPPSHPRQGAALRLIVRPGVVNLQQNGEGIGMWHCRFSDQYPMGPNHQQPQHPPTHIRTVQVPPLTWATVVLAMGTGQWCRCLD